MGYRDLQRSGTLRKPSMWVIGDWNRPVRLQRLPDPKKKGEDVWQLPRLSDEEGKQPSARSGRSFSHGSLEKEAEVAIAARTSMATSHSLTEMKRNFALDASVLGKKYTPAHRTSRRLD